MKEQPTSLSAFFNARALIGLVLCSLGLLLALAGLSKSVPGMGSPPGGCVAGLRGAAVV
jgi:hypothetical protein